MALDDLKAEILRYSTENGYPAESIEQLVCDCGSEEFTLFSDDTEGGAVAVCCKCEMNLSIYDSADFMEDVGQNVCTCEGEKLLIMTGIAFHENTKDAQWIYVGAKCTACGLAGVFVDWEEL